MKPKYQRLIFLIVTVIFLGAAMMLTLRAFKENLVYFYSPSDLITRKPTAENVIRIGGIVDLNSVIHTPSHRVMFRITDGKTSIHIAYGGTLPTLFREGQGVIAEGRLVDPEHFEATTILAKHDEKYMPKEVVDSLKKSGYWQKDYAR